MFIVGLKKAKEKIIEKYPEFKDSEFIEDNTGWANYVVKVDNKYIFRFPRNYPAYKVIKLEKQILVDLKRFEIEVPNFIFSCFEEEGPFVGYKMIEGEFFSKEKYEKLSKDKKEIFIKEMAVFLSNLHMLNPNNYKMQAFDCEKEYTNLYNDIKKYAYKIFNEKEREFTDKHFENYFSNNNLQKFNNCLVHGDLSGDHIIFTNNGVGIIDFGDVRVMDPAYDFIWAYDVSEPLFDEIYKYYNGKKDNYFKYRIKEFYRKNVPYYGIVFGIQTRNDEILKKSLNDFKKIVKESN